MSNLTLSSKSNVPTPPLVGVELNPGPASGKKLNEEQRWRVIHLSSELHLSQRQIAKRMQISQKTVNHVLKKYRDTASVKERPRTGRKRKISAKDEKRIVKLARKEKSASEIARIHNLESAQKISEITVRRVLSEHDFFYLPKVKVQPLSETHMQSRLDYATEMKSYDWRRVLFSDEKTFHLGSVSSHCWQQLDQRVEQKVTRYPPKLHVWAAAGYYFKTKLYFFLPRIWTSTFTRKLPRLDSRKRALFTPLIAQGISRENGSFSRTTTPSTPPIKQWKSWRN